MGKRNLTQESDIVFIKADVLINEEGLLALKYKVGGTHGPLKLTTDFSETYMKQGWTFTGVGADLSGYTKIDTVKVPVRV